MTGRALVLGGGGVTGVAWALGVLSGLAAAGIRLADADLVIGTSAGALLGSQLAAGVDVEELYRAQLDTPPAEPPVRLGRGTLARLAWALYHYGDPRQSRAAIGRIALATHDGHGAEPAVRRRRAVESRLIAAEWPRRPLVIAAVDAVSGDLVAFDRAAGVPLADAVAASCAAPGVWPPVPIAGRPMIDGGVRSPANADLAAGCDRVVVLAPVARGLHPAGAVASQVTDLPGRPRAVLLSPDPLARRWVVPNPAYRAAAARAGRTQATRVAATVAAAWMQPCPVSAASAPPRTPVQRPPSTAGSLPARRRRVRRA
ncbi:patatin-like phospholipase family protein [Rhizomonospora bruguierae]|uniref:patatin-like phospholipase family protein n=1 Tax=Rhizomonospora bruguierae TaxID=1581705 RepID=UPI001BCC4724|nr:patatin-like phospholipase family protein [Micromonospora sp. NBRC 107566]